MMDILSMAADGRVSVGTALAPPTSAAELALLKRLETSIVRERTLDHQGAVNRRYRSVWELVAAHGSWSTPAPLMAGIQPRPEEECFTSAAAVEREYPHLAYTEGFVSTGRCVVLHAWCTAPDGRVIDPTWPGGGSAYLGIRLPADLRPRAPHHWGVLEAPDTLYQLLCNGL